MALAVYDYCVIFILPLLSLSQTYGQIDRLQKLPN